MLEEMTVCEEVFHTASGVAFADLVTDGHRETWPIRSKRFRTWVRRCYYQATGTAAGAAVIGSALDLLEAQSRLGLMAGECWDARLCGSGGPPVCCRSRCRRAADRL